MTGTDGSGEPVYTYSPKDGIRTFRIKQLDTTVDDYVDTSDDEVI